MYEDKTVAVVIPAYNEEAQLPRVIATLPDWIDLAVVVDDASPDATFDVARAEGAKRNFPVEVIRLEKNSGVGGAIYAGYARAHEAKMDVTVVMAGDGQMDPANLPALLAPVIRGEAGYAKGNRLLVGDAARKIPPVRLFGNAVLSLMTKVASGYWHVSDSQNGYTAIDRATLGILLAEGFYNRYGMPNDVLVKLNVHRVAVREVPMEPVYHVGERSKMRIPRVVLPILWLLTRRFVYRMWHRYVVRDTHPLVLFYALGIVFFPFGILYSLLIAMTRVVGPTLLGVGWFDVFRPISTGSGMALDAVVTVAGLQFLLFAMLFDMQANERLR